MSAWADFNGAPDVEMKFEAMTGGYAALIAQSPVSSSGTATAADLCGQFAKEAGFSFVNQGIDASIANSVYSGSPLEKAQAVAKQVGADLIIDDDKMTLLPRGESLRGGSVVLLSPETGMIGYPTFTNNGIIVKSFPCNAVGRCRSRPLCPRPAAHGASPRSITTFPLTTPREALGKPR